MELGRHWARACKQAAPRGADEFEDDIAAQGVPESEIDEGQGDDDGEGEDGRFKVWPENERALDTFMAVRRLWRYGPMGDVLGLDRASVESELRMRQIEADAALLDDLAVIEGGVLEVWNAKP